MINTLPEQRRHIVTLTDIPDDVYKITYWISYYEDDPTSNPCFVGTGYVIDGKFEFDLTDYVDYKISHPDVGSEGMMSYFYRGYTESGEQHDTYSGGVDCIEIERPVINLAYISNPNATTTCPAAVLELQKSDLTQLNNNTATDKVHIPLKVENGFLAGKLTSKLDKITYIDRYGDKHNSSVSNRYEIECFVDSEWLGLKSHNDSEYLKVMSALQSARESTLYFKCGLPGIQNIIGVGHLDCHVADIEEITVYSKYVGSNYFKGIKLTLEVYY